MKKIVMILAVGASTLSVGAQAREFAEIYTQCGLGAMIAPSSDAVAAVTNVTWDLGSTAISSNISSPDTCQGGKKKVASLLLQSLPQIEQDLARGQGHYATTLLTSAGCAQAAHAPLLRAVRQDVAQLHAQSGYAAQSRVEKSAAVYDVVKQRVEADFSGACTML